MCGIYMTNRSVSIQEVESKLKTINYRGPDNLGIIQRDEVTLGHLRLSILDLDSRSNQPMSLNDQFTITYNGEIYNYLEVKEELIKLGYNFTTKSDTEVLLIGFKEWGTGVLEKLNGMFAFCIYDHTARKIIAARDRLGVKPFYYYWKDGIFEICSQLRPISENKKINEEAISIYLDCTYIPSPYSIYEDIYKLPPGNYLEIGLSSKELIVKEYWNLKKVKVRDVPYKQAKEELHKLLKDSVSIRLQSDVAIGSFLSGGIDSALVSSIAAKVSKANINTFSIGFDNPNFDESKIAKQYANIIGSIHRETICTANDVYRLIPKLVEVFDEPFADSSALPSLLLNSVTKQYATVALSGDGGDESFLGYNNFDWVIKFNKLVKIPSFIRNIASLCILKMFLGKKAASLRRILKLKTVDDFIQGIFIGYNSLQKSRDTSWMKHYKSFKTLSDNNIQKTADLNIKLWLENDSNVKVDRASMAYSVEIRSPFLDYRIIEFARSLPVEFRYQKGRKKRILRDILQEYIPESVFDHPKKGFSVPIGQWIKDELREEFKKNLKDDFLDIVPNLNKEKFKDMFLKHLEGKNDYSSYIWRVYLLSKWYQEFGFYKLEEKE